MKRLNFFLCLFVTSLLPACGGNHPQAVDGTSAQAAMEEAKKISAGKGDSTGTTYSGEFTVNSAGELKIKCSEGIGAPNVSEAEDMLNGVGLSQEIELIQENGTLRAGDVKGPISGDGSFALAGSAKDVDGYKGALTIKGKFASPNEGSAVYSAVFSDGRDTCKIDFPAKLKRATPSKSN